MLLLLLFCSELSRDKSSNLPTFFFFFIFFIAGSYLCVGTDTSSVVASNCLCVGTDTFSAVASNCLCAGTGTCLCVYMYGHIFSSSEYSCTLTCVCEGYSYCSLFFVIIVFSSSEIGAHLDVLLFLKCLRKSFIS